MYVKWRNKSSNYENFLSKITSIDGAIQNITKGIFTKRCARFCQISLHPAMVKSSSVMMEILSLIPHRSLVSNMYYSSISACTPDGLDSLTFEDAVLKHTAHESIALIKQHTAPCENFRFRVVSHATFKYYIDQLKPDKASGFDGLKAKFMKLSDNKCIRFMCDVFNKCVCTNVFPSSRKLAEISPIYKKKDDNLCKESYRSVNLLIMVSNVFERILADQLTGLLWKFIELLLICPPERLYLSTCYFTVNGILASGSWRTKLCRHCSHGNVEGVWSNATRFTHCKASCMRSVY